MGGRPEAAGITVLLPWANKYPVVRLPARRHRPFGRSPLGAWLPGLYLCSDEPTIADLVCLCDVVFADVSEIDLGRWENVSIWASRLAARAGFLPPLKLLPMADAEFDRNLDVGQEATP